jgi:hypothetical protein
MAKFPRAITVAAFFSLALFVCTNRNSETSKEDASSTEAAAARNKPTVQTAAADTIGSGLSAEVKKVLIGKWVLKEKTPKKHTTLTFGKNGTFSGDGFFTLCPSCPAQEQSVVKMVFSGTYTVEKGVIYRECRSNKYNGEERCGKPNFDREFKDGFCKVMKIGNRWELGIFNNATPDEIDGAKFEDYGQIFVKAQ